LINLKRFRAWRRRAAALALLPAVVAAATTTIAIAATGSAHPARLSAIAGTLDYGESFRLGGTVPGERGTRVQLKFRPAGAAGWKLLRETHTDAEGNYSARARAFRNGALRAVPVHGRASTAEAIRVRSRAAFHVSKHNLVIGKGTRLRGRARPGGRRPVQVVVRGPGGDVLRDASARDGAFALRWRPRTTGTYRLRAYVGRNRLAKGSHSPRRRITVFRYAGASWYGPGFYGNRTACGQVLVPGMMGVANKTLPCGTKVTLRYRGRSVTVPVIDRGPFAAGREYDLTAATKSRLRFPDVGSVLTNR
jgi:rare lipoprotein A